MFHCAYIPVYPSNDFLAGKCRRELCFRDPSQQYYIGTDRAFTHDWLRIGYVQWLLHMFITVVGRTLYSIYYR